MRGAVLTEGRIVGTATRKLDEGSQSVSWHVRNEQGETFGPVDLEALKSWACDGRLAPTNEVSKNGSGWQLATSVRELEMDWVAEVTPGTFYGPIHRRAMAELVKDGSIAAQSAFFVRRGMDARSGQQADVDQAEQARQRVAAREGQAEQARQRAAASEEQAEQARQRAAASEGQAEQARQRAAASEGQAEQARQRAVASEEAAEQARRRAVASEEQAEQIRQRAAASEEADEQARRRAVASEEQAEQIRQRAAASEEAAEQARRRAAASEEQAGQMRLQVTAQAGQVEQMRQQLSVQAEQAQRQVSAYEEQLRLEQQQVAAYEEQVRLAQQQAATLSAQAEQARQQALAADTHLRATVQQMSEQAEQARVAQRQVLDKAEELSGEVARLRTEQAKLLEQAAGLRAERDVRLAEVEEQKRSFEAERQKAGAALSRAQAEVAFREARLVQLEKALAGTEGAGVKRDALESQVLALGAERLGLQQALECEKDAAQQAKARCATLEASLAEAHARSDRESSLECVSAELRQVRKQVEDLCVQVRLANEARESANAERAARRVLCEPVEADVLPPERPKPSAHAPAAERVSPEWHRKPADAPSAPNPGRVSSGVSMSDLEQQARRELERLGAQGANLFKRKK